MSDLRLAGKAAIVTGAGRAGGIGEAIARALAAAGASVLICDIARPPQGRVDSGNFGTAEGLRSIAQAIPARTPVQSAICDVTLEEDVARVVETAQRAFGRLDIVVNNAGIGFIQKPVNEFTVGEWDLVLATNLRGPFLFTKHASQVMIAAGKGGRIINIASKGAKTPAPESAAYASSKHGLVGLTRAAAIDLGRFGITVNAVCPNHVTTALGATQNEFRSRVLNLSVEDVLALRQSRIPLGRVGLPEDTARACVFLASDDAAYITGEALNVSGGEEMH